MTAPPKEANQLPNAPDWWTWADERRLQREHRAGQKRKAQREAKRRAEKQWLAENVIGDDPEGCILRFPKDHTEGRRLFADGVHEYLLDRYQRSKP